MIQKDMEDVQLKITGAGKGFFEIKDNGQRIAEMVISVAAGELTVYHTEVVPEAEGKGLAKKLLAAMVAYAREQGLKVVPLCPYVHAQFARNPAAYADIWKRAGEEA
ncbi:GNAT family N-acetyltransferase [Paraflavisolibacter sp. H34]|uniref:GNAT family N-acetyltransferase n=1 Tax=Huijunlia imazamoxiresistens TaxID=3127457 RepID=UPI00301AFACD